MGRSLSDYDETTVSPSYMDALGHLSFEAVGAFAASRWRSLLDVTRCFDHLVTTRTATDVTPNVATALIDERRVLKGNDHVFTKLETDERLTAHG